MEKMIIVNFHGWASIEDKIPKAFMSAFKGVLQAGLIGDFLDFDFFNIEKSGHQLSREQHFVDRINFACGFVFP